ncbi:uncharacterized protein LOC143254347 isoform X2 [Tachypleus tridentatus]|uniref:uncharacterized protein LOC143254347 isoform X2 n=1 Tax=Tachypleus tridentatus TaxID=6853 RepID=UPI003FD445AA
MVLLMYIFLGIMALLFLAVLSVCAMNSFTTPGVSVDPEEIDAQLVYHFLSSSLCKERTENLTSRGDNLTANPSEKLNTPLLMNCVSQARRSGETFSRDE